MDSKKEIRRAVDTGTVVFGARQAEKSILKSKAQLIIISNNIKTNLLEKFQQLSAISAVPLYKHNSNSKQLGSICGKPFVLSVMAIEKPGKSKILGIVKEKKTREKK